MPNRDQWIKYYRDRLYVMETLQKAHDNPHINLSALGEPLGLTASEIYRARTSGRGPLETLTLLADEANKLLARLSGSSATKKE